MEHAGQFMARALLVAAAGLIALPGQVLAQSEPTMRVERTPSYTIVLDVGPTEAMVSSMDAMQGVSGEVAVDGETAAMMADQPDQGMAVNHHMAVHVMLADSDDTVMDVTPTIRITNKDTGETRSLPHVTGMYGSTMGMSDFHFGQNLFLADGTYLVTVEVGPDTALFRDVLVMAEQEMMSDHGMAP